MDPEEIARLMALGIMGRPQSFADYAASYPRQRATPKAEPRPHMPAAVRDAPTFTPEQAKAVLPSVGMAVAGMLPGVGEGMDAYELGRGLEQRDYGRAGLAAAGLALPGVAAASLKRVANPIKAYHGSPHDFDKFDMSKIGTGEGAQVYGHGLYFAENPEVAESYRATLAKAPTETAPAWRLNGEPVARGTDRFRLASILEGAGSPKAGEDAAALVQRRIGELEDQARFAESAYGPDAATMYRLQADELRKVDPSALTYHRPGRTYEVAIKADPDEFLDWDLPLGEQPERVRQAIVPEFQKRMIPTGMESADDVGRGYPGRDIYRELTTEHAQRWDAPPTNPKAEATASLRGMGIKGIRYYDQGSRPLADVSGYERAIAEAREKVAATTDPVWRKAHQDDLAILESQLAKAKAIKPTSNYVVFDDSLVEILRKYGLAGLMGAGIGGHLATEQR